jgi:hypothetical protein
MSPITFRPAKRENVPLLIGLAGGTGSGKTYSAMRLAKGLAGDKPFAVIDTENGRAQHYADDFAFDHAALHAPFRPDAYAAAIEEAAKQGYGVIIVDSMSHEWEGDGGMLDYQEEEFQRLGGRDAVKMTSWIKPKMAHRKFVTRLLQVPAHVILAFRAAEKVDMVRGENGKMEVIPKRTLTGLDGWVPITEKNLPYELTLSCLLTADAPGIPKPIKLQEQHRPMLPLDQPIGEDTGRTLAEWAKGSTPAPKRKTETEAARLTSELLELAAQMDKRDEVADAVNRHRAGHTSDPARHVAWLKAQVKRAHEATQALAAVGAEAGDA